jgi:hypothetical protein
METTTLSKEQKEMRVGRFTGCENYKLMGAKGFGKTGETYITEKAAEFLTGQPIKAEFTAQSTQWGIDHETEAKLYFEAATKTKVIPSTTLDNGFICGTPDGLVDGDNCGFEIKCPFNSGNHLKNFLMSTGLDLLTLRPEYYWQCVSYMWLTGFERWKFCSYDPRFKEEKRMLILNLTLEKSHLQLLQNRVTEATLMFNNIISKLK